MVRVKIPFPSQRNGLNRTKKVRNVSERGEASNRKTWRMIVNAFDRETRYTILPPGIFGEKTMPREVPNFVVGFK